MEIGIITLPLHTNYGGVLQAYALQKVLTHLGHNATLIDHEYRARLPMRSRYLIYIKRAFLRYVMGKDIDIFPDIAQNKPEDTKRKHTNSFIKQHIKRIAIKNVQEIKEGNFDCYVVGSDQIWRHPYNKYFPGVSNSFLDFAKDWDVKRIAYAASFGTDDWEYNEEETELCGNLARKFDAISVREDSAVKLCKEKFGADAIHLLDPTMLLSIDDYRKLFTSAETLKSPGNLMCYILDPNNNARDLIEIIAKKNSLEPFHSNSRVEDENAPIEERIQPPLESWLRGFHDAEFVITDSFHACVFSIIFNKPFIVVGNKQRGLARIRSLLSIFNLEDRLVEKAQEANAIINNPIDWDRVNSTLNIWQEKSFGFLKEALK